MPNPFAHIELTTDNLKQAQKFYSKVFAWKLSDVPGMTYTMIDVSGGTGGGMQPRPMPEAPTGWMPYVQVDDVKATLNKATKAGGAVELPYHEIGDMGAIGIFRDPAGSRLGIWESKRTASPQGASSTDEGDGEGETDEAEGADGTPTRKTRKKASTPTAVAVRGSKAGKKKNTVATSKKKAPPARKKAGGKKASKRR